VPFSLTSLNGIRVQDNSTSNLKQADICLASSARWRLPFPLQLLSLFSPRVPGISTSKQAKNMSCLCWTLIPFPLLSPSSQTHSCYQQCYNTILVCVCPVPDDHTACYDTTGSSDDKSLGGAWAILRDDTKAWWLSVGLVRSVRQLRGTLVARKLLKGLILKAEVEDRGERRRWFGFVVLWTKNTLEAISSQRGGLISY